MSLVIWFNLGEHWQVAREKNSGRAGFSLFSFLDLGLSYTVVWVGAKFSGLYTVVCICFFL